MESKILSAQSTDSSFYEYEQSSHTFFSKNVFPILDHLSQIYFPFQFLEIIQVFFCILQIFETTYWEVLGTYWKDSKLEDIIHYFTYFSSADPSLKEIYILFGVLISVVLVITILFILLTIHYNKTRRIIKPLLYIVRVYFILFGSVILHPLASLLSHFTIQVIDYHDFQFLILLVLTFIGLCLAEALFYFNQTFVNMSIYIQKSAWSTFDSTNVYILFMWNPLFIFVSHLFKYYPLWAFYVLVVVHVLVIVFSLLDYIWLSFIFDTSDFIFAAIFESMIFNDIFRLVVENFPQFTYSIFVITSILAYLVFALISFFVLRHFRKKINFNLSYSKLNPPEISPDEANLKQVAPSIEDKYMYFNEIGLDHKLKKAMMYLIVGFTSGSDMFVDFSLVQYCIDNYSTNEMMLSLLIRLLSYFKTEKNRFDIVLKQYHSLRNTSQFGRFIYNQAHKVKLFRQSTSTKYSSTRLSDLKLLTASTENQAKAFWTLETANSRMLEQMEEQTRKLSDLWDESIEDNWSSIMFREEHIRFLIESCTDFQKAVQMTSIKDKIDILNGQRDDLCFLSLVSCFPQYIKNKIVDSEGNFLVKKLTKNHSTSSSVANQSEHYSTSSGDNDFSLEEQIANQILTYGRLRLSMQNALHYVKPSIGRVLTIYSVVSVVFSFVMITATFCYFVRSFDSYNDWNNQVGVLNELRVSYGRSFLCLSIMFGQELNIFNIDDFNCEKVNDLNHYFFDNTVPFKDLALMYVNDARDQYSELMAAILDLALRRQDISTLTSLFFDISINSSFCYFDSIVDQNNWSMEQSLNFGILSFAILAEDEDIANWYNNSTYWCHDITNIPQVERMFTVIHNALIDDLSNTSLNKMKKTKIQMILIAPIFFVVFFVPLPFILFYYNKEINHLIKMMLLTDQEYKEQARKNISLSVTNNETNNEAIPLSSKLNFNWKFMLRLTAIFLIFCIIVLMEEMILYFTYSINIKVRNYGYWSCFFALLRSYLNEILIDIINAVYIFNYDKSYLSNNQIKERIRYLLLEIKHVVFSILIDSTETPSAVGKDDYVDKLVLQPTCENPLPMNLHDVYDCASLSKLMSTIYTLIEKVIEEIEIFDGAFQGEELSNLYHIIFSHAISTIREVRNHFIYLQSKEIKDYKRNILLFFISALVLILVLSLLISTLIVSYKQIFNMAICLIRRLSPVGLINNSELTSYLLYKKGDEVEMGVTHTIFNNSFDGIICMNPDGIVEIINKSFANDYGYSTEQLVGQMIGTIFDNESRTKLENQLKLMKNHESTNYAEHVICFTNDGRSIPSHITLFSIKGSENSLILVIRDETILLQKKKRLELAKKQSQDLLEQIMPPKVLAMLKEGKSEISFAVPTASVMFVNIVNFSGFSADLSPQQIMGTLSTLFGAFDTWIQKFPLMTKIKLIGDSYMAACGLFEITDDPKNHATQCVEFGILVLNILEDTNIKLNVNLQIRIGINSDGPIIAGVLGTENRVFDIIGDTINVASRLEHKAVPGHIMISEKTFNLVQDCGFNIVAVGEVFLKGKGNMMAYAI